MSFLFFLRTIKGNIIDFSILFWKLTNLELLVFLLELHEIFRLSFENTSKNFSSDLSSVFSVLFMLPLSFLDRDTFGFSIKFKELTHFYFVIFLFKGSIILRYSTINFWKYQTSSFSSVLSATFSFWVWSHSVMMTSSMTFSLTSF